jgi:hypothetical protein
VGKTNAARLLREARRWVGELLRIEHNADARDVGNYLPAGERECAWHFK